MRPANLTSSQFSSNLNGIPQAFNSLPQASYSSSPTKIKTKKDFQLKVQPSNQQKEKSSMEVQSANSLNRNSINIQNISLNRPSQFRETFNLPHDLPPFIHSRSHQDQITASNSSNSLSKLASPKSVILGNSSHNNYGQDLSQQFASTKKQKYSSSQIPQYFLQNPQQNLSKEPSTLSQSKQKSQRRYSRSHLSFPQTQSPNVTQNYLEQQLKQNKYQAPSLIIPQNHSPYLPSTSLNKNYQQPLPQQFPDLQSLSHKPNHSSHFSKHLEPFSPDFVVKHTDHKFPSVESPHILLKIKKFPEQQQYFHPYMTFQSASTVTQFKERKQALRKLNIPEQFSQQLQPAISNSISPEQLSPVYHFNRQQISKQKMNESSRVSLSEQTELFPQKNFFNNANTFQHIPEMFSSTSLGDSQILPLFSHNASNNIDSQMFRRQSEAAQKTQFNQHRKSVNHDFYSNLHKIQMQKAKDDYLFEEVAKARVAWWSYSQEQQTEQQYSHEHHKQRASQIQVNKDIEAKQQEIFANLISNAKLASSSIESCDLPSLKSEDPILLKIENNRKDQGQGGQALQQQMQQELQLDQLQRDRILTNTSQEQVTQQSEYHFGANSAMIDNNETNRFWQGTVLWEGMVRDLHLDIKQENIFGELTYQMLLDYLNNIVGRIFNNNIYYLHESLKQVGLTPITSALICDKMCQIMLNKYNIQGYNINKFRQLYEFYEQKHLKWNVIDKIGGQNKINDIIQLYTQLLKRDAITSGILRALAITDEQISQAALTILREQDLKHKQFFGLIEQFFKNPLSRLSHSKFYLAIHVYLKGALDKQKVDQIYRSKLLLMIEQTRHLVTGCNDLDLIIIQNNDAINKKEKLHNNNNNANNNESDKVGEKGEEDKSIEAKPEDVPNTNSNNGGYQFCSQFAKDFRKEMNGILKYKQSLNKLFSHQENTSSNSSMIFQIESNISYLCEIFVLNTHPQHTFYSLLQYDKILSFIKLTDDFFSFFTKKLLDYLKPLSSCYLYKDTFKRIQIAKIILFKSTSHSSSNQLNNYLNNSSYFDDLIDHPQPLEYLLDKLVEQYLSSSVNKLFPLARPSRARAHLRFIMTYFYQFIDQNGYPEFISSYDFQCYLFYKKIKFVFFNDFKKLLKDFFTHTFNFPQQLVNKLMQDFNVSLVFIKFIDQQEEKRKSISQISELHLQQQLQLLQSQSPIQSQFALDNSIPFSQEQHEF